MKTLFASFWKRNLAFFKLAIVTNLEYRLNFFIDAVAQPAMTTIVELILWNAVFIGAGTDLIAGFDKSHYLSYALWAAFFARVASNWMYEFRMIEEIDSGSINSILVRPMSFYEYYLSQLLGYKFITTVVSMIFPFLVIYSFGLPSEISRFPMAFLMLMYYVVFLYATSFCIASIAFQFNKIHSLTVVKNLAIWIFTGELFPLDLLPENIKQVFLALPFSSGVYRPVAYITGRIDLHQMIQGFYSITLGIIIVNIIGYLLWKKGMRSYLGTGA